MSQGQFNGSTLSKIAPSAYGVDVGACDQGQRQAEIPHQMERLGRTLEGCMKGLEVLAMKLESSVMRGEPPSTSCDKAAAPIASTRLGGLLQDAVQAAATINARIESLTARLEV